MLAFSQMSWYVSDFKSFVMYMDMARIPSCEKLFENTPLVEPFKAQRDIEFNR